MDFYGPYSPKKYAMSSLSQLWIDSMKQSFLINMHGHLSYMVISIKFLSKVKQCDEREPPSKKYIIHLNVKNVHRNFPTSISAGNVLDSSEVNYSPLEIQCKKGKITKIMFSLQCKFVSPFAVMLFSTLICSLQRLWNWQNVKWPRTMAMFIISIVLKSNCCNDYSNESAAWWTDLSSSGSLIMETNAPCDISEISLPSNGE